MYDTVLLDLDLTLFDFRASERLAFADCLRLSGLADVAELHDSYFEQYKVINHRMWAQVEAGELTPEQAGRQRFEVFLRNLGLKADPIALSDAFQHGLGVHGELYDGAQDLLEALALRSTTVMVTNGISGVQRAKIQRLKLERWFDHIVISDEVGAAKPSAAIFDHVFDLVGDDKRPTALMVGDSVTSDIAGAAVAGIDGCWYNPARRNAPERPRITHQITALPELLRLVG